jgi:ATP-dependent Lon protease
MTEPNPKRHRLPVLPLRDMVLFPGVTAPIGAGRPGTLRAIESALKGEDRLIFAVTQRETSDAVQADGLYSTGTIARI